MTDQHRSSDDNGSESTELTPSITSVPIVDPAFPFRDLEIPQPIESAPPTRARWLAFAAIILGGLLGGLIGYGTGDLLGGSSLWGALGALVGAVFCAAGVGIVATLTLRAMNEWNAVQHPESQLPAGAIADHLSEASDPE